MPWKQTEDGGIATQDVGGVAHPVWVKDDGTEEPFDAGRALGTITRLTGENRDRRTKAEEIEAKFAPFEGIDPEEARKALDVVKNLDDKKLIAAGEVDRVKKEVRDAYEAKMAEIQKSVDERDGRIRKLLVSQRFATSDFFSGKQPKTILPPDVAESYFNDHFQVEGDKVVAYRDPGTKKEPIYSQKAPGDTADFDEAIDFLINNHPHKDRLLAGSGASGSNAPVNGNRPGANPDMSKLPAVERLNRVFKESTPAT